MKPTMMKIKTPNEGEIYCTHAEKSILISSDTTDRETLVHMLMEFLFMVYL